MKSGVLWCSVAAVLCVAGFLLWWSPREPAELAAMRLSPAGQAGATLAGSRGCFACHSVDGSVGIGPSWAGSYGSIRVLQDGSTVAVDDNYLRRSMQEPAAQVVQGFENLMVPANLSDAEIDMLIGLIRELGTGQSP